MIYIKPVIIFVYVDNESPRINDCLNRVFELPCGMGHSYA